MKNEITNLLFLNFLIPAVMSKEALVQDPDNIGKDQDLSDEDSRSIQAGETSTKQGINQNLDEEIRPTQSEQKNAAQYGINKDFIDQDTRPSIDEKKASERHSQNRDLVQENIRPILEEQKTERHNNLKEDRRPSQTRDFVEDDKPYKDQQKISEFKRKNKKLSEDSRPSLDEHTTPETHQNNNTTITDENITPAHHSRLNVDRSPSHRDHTMVTDNDFAYMVAVLKGATYMCAGALIDESWVLTAADGVHLMRETMRFLRIRLGSINYKKGGTLLPVKNLEIHPYFNSSKPTYDLALIMLAKPVRLTAKLRSIRLQFLPKEVTSTHFLMTSWAAVVKPGNNQPQSSDIIKHQRMLSVAHLHPSDPQECVRELREISVPHDGVMCFENVLEHSCMRDTGAPVVINGVLWGVISSWIPEECDEEDSFIYATLVSARNISTWIHATIHGHKWIQKNK